MSEASPLMRRPGEQFLQHRGLLLYAMQHPDRRSVRAVARAVARNEATVRGWSKRGDWNLRCDPHDTEVQAVAMYRADYLPQFGMTELPEVAANIVVPMNASPKVEVPPPKVQDDVAAADQKVRDEILRRRESEQKTRSKHLGLIDAGLGYLVQELKEKRVRVSLRDIPIMLEARALLSGEAESSGPTAAGVAAFESVRVRQTRAAGGNVLEAVRQDLLELDIILNALAVRQEMNEPMPVDLLPATPRLHVVNGGRDDEPDDDEDPRVH